MIRRPGFENLLRVVVIAVLAQLSLPAITLGQTYASDVGIEEDDVRLGQPEYSPYLNRAYPDRVLFGDTHLHTSYSTDAKIWKFSRTKGSACSSFTMSAQRPGLDAVPCTRTSGMRPGW